MSDPKPSSKAPLAVAAFLLVSLQLILGRTRIVGETFVNNDDLMRAMQVKDLLNGQGWWDLHQYRLGIEGDLVMHWTRHVDALLLAVILPLRPFLGDEAALKVAGIALPILLAVLMLYLVSKIARLIGGEQAVIPSLFFAVASLWTLTQFSVGRIDHHNLQIVLALIMILGVLKLEHWRSALLAATGAGVALSVGLEAVGVVAGVMITAGLIFVRVGRPARTGTAVFFAGTPLIGLSSSLIFAPPARILGTACDVLSRSVLVPLFIIGAGVAATVWKTSERASRRLIALGAVAGSGLVWLFFSTPQCLSGPFAAVDPWLRANWIEHVQEAQSIIQVFQRTPGWAIGWLIPVLGAFIVLVTSIRQGAVSFLWRLLPILATSTAVALTQARGVPIVAAISVPVLGLVLVKAQHRFPSTSPLIRGMAMAALVVGLSGVIPPILGAPDETAAQASDCDAHSAEAISAIPPGSRVLGPLDLGPELLTALPQNQILGAPYHRNNAGNLLTMQVPRMTPGEAETAIRAANIEVLVVCEAENPPTPGSLGALLLADDPPEFLDTLVDESPFKVFIVIR